MNSLEKWGNPSTVSCRAAGNIRCVNLQRVQPKKTQGVQKAKKKKSVGQFPVPNSSVMKSTPTTMSPFAPGRSLMGNVYRDKGGIMRGGLTFGETKKTILVNKPAAKCK
ncbi:hypothetical protein VTH06DRAFT_1191 [Thermothelomyces fergusii]